MADISLDDYILKNQNQGLNTTTHATMQGKKPLNRQGPGPQFKVVGLGKATGFDARQKLSQNKQQPVQDARQKLSQKKKFSNVGGTKVQIQSAGVHGRIRIPRIQAPGNPGTSPRIQTANSRTNVRTGTINLKRPSSAPGPIPNKISNVGTQDMRVKIQNSKMEKLDARQMIRARQKAKEAVEAASQPKQPPPIQRIMVTGLGNNFQDTGGALVQGDGSPSVLSLGGSLQKTISSETFEEDFEEPMTVIKPSPSPLRKTIQNPSAIPTVSNRVGNNIVIAPDEQPYHYQQPTEVQSQFSQGQYIPKDPYVQTSYNQPQYSQPQYVQPQQQQQQQLQQQHHQQETHPPHFREPMPMIRIQNDDYRSPVVPSPSASVPVQKPVLRQDYSELYRDRDDRQPTRVTQPRSAAPKPVLQARLGDMATDESFADVVSPLQGYRVMITNLHHIVTQDDIVELFGAVGALRKVRLIRPGTAEVVFIKKEEALAAIRKYHNRELDGQPMQVILTTGGNPGTPKTLSHEETSSQPIRLPKSSGGGGDGNSAEVDVGLLHKALFKTTTKEDPPTRPVTFTVKI